MTPQKKREYRDRKAKEYAIKSNFKKRNIGYPCGINYVKPFTKLNKGFGYVGVLSHDLDTGELQCHICGGWFKWLNNHITSRHKMKVADYKKKFGLLNGTALVSDEVRLHLIQRARSQPYEAMMKGRVNIDRANKTNRKGHHKKSESNKSRVELQNKLGVCRKQTLKRLEEISKELGRQPYKREMLWPNGGSMETVVKHRFGCLAKAREELAKLGYKYKSRKDIFYTDEQLLEDIRMFIKNNKRRPVASDFERSPALSATGTNYRHFGSLTKAIELATN